MTSGDGRLVLDALGTQLTVDAATGGRLASLVVDGHELLLTDGAGPIWWGCFPMAPFAGRIRDGRFTFRDRQYRLERNLPPHAIHGTVLDRAWQVLSLASDRLTLATDLGPRWPFAGRVSQTIVLQPDRLDATLTLEADEPMPAWLGWHPWFRRTVDGSEVVLEVAPESMYARGPDGLPTGRLIAPAPPPWDDAFVGLGAAPRLRWPGLLDLEINASADVWVIFDEREDGLCVEPQTAPPDAINLAQAEGSDPPTAEPGRPLTATMSWRWSRPG